MKISVVTAVLNRRRTIGDTLASVAAQDHDDLEHVVQDGGSTDGTLDIVAEAARPATRLYSEPDAGLYDAINRGIRKAEGEVIGLLHSDDVFADGTVLSRIAAAFEVSGADGVYGDLTYVNESGRVLRHWTSGAYDPAKLRQGWMPPHPTLYLKREVFDRWGLYDTSFRIAADYDAMLRYLLKGGIRLHYVPDVLVRMRTGGASNGSIGQIFRKSREDLRAIRRNGAGGIGTLASKNLRKLDQFLPKA